MIIDNDSHDNAVAWTAETLDNLRYRIPQYEERCVCCGHKTYHQVRVRQRDINLMSDMIRSAERVMRDYGITGNLLAEIEARCYIEIAKRKAMEGVNESISPS